MNTLNETEDAHGGYPEKPWYKSKDGYKIHKYGDGHDVSHNDIHIGNRRTSGEALALVDRHKTDASEDLEKRKAK
jgi:hypothetical protein